MLITGIPASGKTTFTKQMEKLYNNIARIGFGDLIHQQMQDNVSYNELRKLPTDKINSTIINQIRDEIPKIIESLSDGKIILLDSHAVVHDIYGFRIIPELAQEINNLKAIILLDTN